VAVDQSAEMLAYVRGAETVCADIELLNLGCRFVAVLLASQLVNTGNDEQRQAFLRTCRRHATPGGAVLIQRLPLDWTASTGEVAERDGVQMALRDVHEQDGLVSAAMEYRAGERQWRHAFTARNLDDTEFDRALAEANLILDRWCDDRRCWAVARPRPTIVID